MDENLQAANATTEVNNPTADAAVSETKASPVHDEKPNQEEPHTVEEQVASYTTADIQSAKSKAKYSILQELGVTSVKEFKDYKSSLDTTLTENQQKLSDLMSQNSALSEKIAVINSGINEEYKEQALKLAHLEVNDNVTIEQALEKVVGEFPFFKKGVANPKIGMDKSTVTNNHVNDIDASLSKKYGIVYKD